MRLSLGKLRPAEQKLPAFPSPVCAGLWGEAVT